MTMPGNKRRLIVVLISIVCVGCASVAPLDNVTLKDIRLATSDDMARYARAENQRSRELFGGAAFSDGNGRVTSFTSNEYDKYLAYKRDHTVSAPISGLYRKPNWPVVRISFQTRRVLFDPESAPMPNAQFSLCDPHHGDGRLWGFGMPELMWHNHFVTPKIALQIEEELRTEPHPQTYEIFFTYVYWNRSQKQVLPNKEPVMLLPLPGDLCVALVRWNYLFPASVGRPLRIGKNVINGTIGTLPRPLPLNSLSVRR